MHEGLRAGARVLHDPADVSPPSPSRFSVIVPLIVGCAQFMHQFDGTMITTALPVMAVSLNEDPLKLNLAITCYLLALAVFVPISGWMADRYGARHVFFAAIAVFTVSSVLCGLSGSLEEIVLWRTVQGIGGAMMTPVGRVIVVKSVPRVEILRAMNYVTIPAVLAPLIGPSVGGFIVTYFSWPWIFFLNLPIGIAGLILVYIYVPDLREEEVTPLDLRGFVLVGLALAGLVFGFAAIGRGAMPTSVIVASISIGAICGSLYLAHARRKSDPIIDLTLLKNRTFAASVFGGGLFYLGTTAQVFLMALLLQVGFGFSAFHAGLTMLAGAVGSTVMRFTFRPVLNAIGFRRMLICNGLLTGACLAACGLFTAQTSADRDAGGAVRRRTIALDAIHRRAIARLCGNPVKRDEPRDQLLVDDAAADAELRRRPHRAGGSRQHGGERARRRHHGPGRVARLLQHRIAVGAVRHHLLSAPAHGRLGADGTLVRPCPGRGAA